MPKKQVTLSEINRKLNKLLKEQESLHKEHSTIKKTGRKIAKAESAELSGLEKLKLIQKEISRTIEPHPLRKITLRDIAQGTIGAFFGVLAHFTFFYGVKVAHQLSLTRAILLFPLSLVIGSVFLYATGFRKVPRKYLWYLPVRLGVLLFVAVSMAILVLAIFEPAFGHDLIESFKQVATVSLIGLLGAITADLIGKE
jgi:uncharacterized membrane protein